jgi:hypothetical protein
MADSNIENVPQGLAYDLRQTYAEIVGNILKEINYYRNTQDTRNYFYSLRRLFIVIKHRLERHLVDTKPYYEFISNIQGYIKNHKTVWLGIKKNPTIKAEIDEELNQLEMWLWYAADEAKIFGDRDYEYDPYEI